MFHAGVVAPSSVRLLQLLTPPNADCDEPLTESAGVFSDDRKGLPRPPMACDAWLETVEPVPLVLLAPLGRP